MICIEHFKDGSISPYNPKLPEKLEDLPDTGTFKPNKVRVGLGVTYVQFKLYLVQGVTSKHLKLVILYSKQIVILSVLRVFQMELWLDLLDQSDQQKD